MIRYNTKRYWGYSTEQKPIDAQIGDRFLEIDTNVEYVFSNYNNWAPIGIVFTGGTISGDTIFNGGLTATTIFTTGLTATTIFATDYQNLPQSATTYVTGFTYSSNKFTISDSSGSTFDASFNSVTGLTVNGNLTVTGNTTVGSISAATYQNLPFDESLIIAYSIAL